MTRLSAILEPKIKPRQAGLLDKYLWSYRFSDFILLVLNRNRGYLSRKVFNILFELIEFSFLAFFCHPDFYISLLFIPFSSFFMNLMNEELFSLNRSANFDASSMSSRLNYIVISTLFICFSLITANFAIDILKQHWILATIFIARLSLIAVQSFSFAYSLEITTKKRVYFSPLNWWVGLLMSLLSLFIINFSLPMETTVTIGIICIYLSRIFIEGRFLQAIWKLRFERRIFRTSGFEIRNFITRFAMFLVNIVTFYQISTYLSGNRGGPQVWEFFFFFIFTLRLLNRPFRALQIDFMSYLKLRQKYWIFLRQTQALKLNLLFLAPLFSYYIYTTKQWELTAPLGLLLLNLNLHLFLGSVGQEVRFKNFFFPIRLVSILIYAFAPGWTFLPVFYLVEFSILSLSLNIFAFRSKRLPDYLSSIKAFSLDRYSSLKPLSVFHAHQGNFLLLFFNPDTNSHLKKLFKDQVSWQPIMISDHIWVIMDVNLVDPYQIWRTFPREMRQIKVVNRAEMIGHFPSFASKGSPLNPNAKRYSKIDEKWHLAGELVQDPELLKTFADIENQSSNSRNLTDRKFSFYQKSHFFYPLINLDEVETIIQTEVYFQHLVDEAKEKSWLSLKSYFSS